jgi:Saxitoxin biosynthesis operon protein SxtJ
MARKPSRRERSFGLSVGGVLVAIAAVLLWRGRIIAAEAMAIIGALLIAAGALRPALLAVPSAIWWRVALLLGWINARIILTIAFAVLLTPIGWLWRATGRDPLARNRRTFSGWVPYPARYNARDHYRRMF